MIETRRSLVGPRIRDAAWWMLLVLGSLIFVLHFTAIQLMNMPMNPIKLNLYPTLDRYVNPYFTQNWSFFAPDPIADDLSTMVRGEWIDSSKRLRITPWFDVSDTLIDSAKGQPLSPLSSVSLALSNATVQFINSVNKNAKASYDKNGKHFIRTHLTSAIDPLDSTIMTRIGMAALRGRYPEVRFEHVQVAVRIYIFPRFTKRAEPDHPATGRLVQLQWQKAPAVTPFAE